MSTLIPMLPRLELPPLSPPLQSRRGGSATRRHTAATFLRRSRPALPRNGRTSNCDACTLATTAGDQAIPPEGAPPQAPATRARRAESTGARSRAHSSAAPRSPPLACTSRSRRERCLPGAWPSGNATTCSPGVTARSRRPDRCLCLFCRRRRHHHCGRNNAQNRCACLRRRCHGGAAAQRRRGRPADTQHPLCARAPSTRSSRAIASAALPPGHRQPRRRRCRRRQDPPPPARGWTPRRVSCVMGTPTVRRRGCQESHPELRCAGRCWPHAE